MPAAPADATRIEAMLARSTCGRVGAGGRSATGCGSQGAEIGGDMSGPWSDLLDRWAVIMQDRADFICDEVARWACARGSARSDGGVWMRRSQPDNALS